MSFYLFIGQPNGQTALTKMTYIDFFLFIRCQPYTLHFFLTCHMISIISNFEIFVSLIFLVLKIYEWNIKHSLSWSAGRKKLERKL